MSRKNSLILFSLYTLLLSYSSVLSFDYKNGGLDWSGLCKDGKNQSPIDIQTASTKVFASTYFYLISSNENNFTITNNSNEYSIQSENLGDIFFYLPDPNGSKTNQYSDYIVRNISIHAPSEHSINGKYFDLEIQILAFFNYGQVNSSYQVLSLLCTVDQEASETDSFFENILENQHSLNINSLVFQDQTNFKTFIYQGSLTVPPCTENVIWFVRKTPYKISLKYLQAFRDKWENNVQFADGRGNNRQIQSLNDRMIYSNDGQNFKNLK
jgi:carbonic anhydrase